MAHEIYLENAIEQHLCECNEYDEDIINGYIEINDYSDSYSDSDKIYSNRNFQTQGIGRRV